MIIFNGHPIVNEYILCQLVMRKKYSCVVRLCLKIRALYCCVPAFDNAGRVVIICIEHSYSYLYDYIEYEYSYVCTILCDIHAHISTGVT